MYTGASSREVMELVGLDTVFPPIIPDLERSRQEEASPQSEILSRRKAKTELV